jgi:hypothetical protein
LCSSKLIYTPFIQIASLSAAEGFFKRKKQKFYVGRVEKIYHGDIVSPVRNNGRIKIGENE